MVKLVVGEVKNTSSFDYVITGLEELLDYVHFVRNGKGEYLLGGDVDVLGIICVEDVVLNYNADSRAISVVKRGYPNLIIESIK